MMIFKLIPSPHFNYAMLPMPYLHVDVLVSSLLIASFLL